MSSSTPLVMQRAVLLALFNRATKGHGSDASVSRPRISELVEEIIGIRLPPAVLQIHLDGLIAADLVSMPQRGVRDRYQITAKGIQDIDAESLASQDSALSESWTGKLDRSEITEEDQQRIAKKIGQLRVVIDNAELTNSERSQATALMAAAVSMTEAPDPPWEIVKQVLLIIGSISTVLTFALEVAKLIR